ncbi:MAG: hypothetical protein ACR2JU_07540 [Nocardioidaceae bacterium]
MSASDSASITVVRRFRGPARSGNGGYTAGRLATTLDGLAASRPVTVTLRRPPPLDVEMVVADGAEHKAGIELRQGEHLVATAAVGSFESAAAAPVDVEAARAARSSYRGAREHPFPECFVCGPARERGDGLRLEPGSTEPGRTACLWVPDPSLSSAANPTIVASAFGWAALDCPGGWTSDIGSRPLVLGRMTASSEQPRVGRPHVVVGQLVREEGRKTFTATALYDEGRLVGRAEQTWIAVDPASFQGPT